jgi:hypothetical protein
MPVARKGEWRPNDGEQNNKSHYNNNKSHGL